MEKVSILITTDNSENTLYNCLESLLNQDYSNYEIIVLDKGSIDNTIAIVKWFAKENKNILLVREKNASIMALWKKGLALSTGEYVCFVEPNSILNRKTITELQRSMVLYEADIAMASFIHSSYKKYYEDKIYNLTEVKDYLLLQQDFIACATLTGKLFKKKLFNLLTTKEVYFREEILNLVAFLKAKRLISLKSVLCISQEHKALFEIPHFWEDHQSFWFKTRATSTYSKQIYHNLKPKALKINVNALIHQRALDYLIWELLTYMTCDASLEEIAMELFKVLKDDTFQEAKKDIEFAEFKFKEMTENELLAACLLYAYTIINQTEYIRGNYPQMDIINIHYMIFIKIFYRQSGSIDPTKYLCKLREALNLNESIEAKLVNQMDLSC